MKRRVLFTKETSVKRQKHVINDYELIVKPFIDAGLLKGDDNDSFIKEQKKVDPVNKQLATFITTSLDNEKFLNSFMGVKFTSKLPDEGKVCYDTEERSLVISTNDETSPITYLIHEGIHALDDLYMCIPRAVVNKIARLEIKEDKAFSEDFT